MPAFLATAFLLALLIGVGGAAIVMIRRARGRALDDQVEWERTLGRYKNLRDQGVLSEEEYRNIRTLVEPRTRIGTPARGGRQQPTVDDAGPKHGRE